MANSLWIACKLTFQQELLLVYRHLAEMLNPLFFFSMIICLFPLAITPDPHVLQLLAPGILWIAALLSVLLTLERLFRTDLQDGSLEQLLLSPQPLAPLVLAKLLAHWLMSAVPLILLAPLLGVTLHLAGPAIGVLMLSLLLGTPTLILLGAIGKALTFQLRNSSLLVTLLVLPLYIPLLIFGAGSVILASQGLDATAELAWLGVLLLLALPLAPMAIAAALRVGIV